MEKSENALSTDLSKYTQTEASGSVWPLEPARGLQEIKTSFPRAGALLAAHKNPNHAGAMARQVRGSTSITRDERAEMSEVYSAFTGSC